MRQLRRSIGGSFLIILVFSVFGATAQAQFHIAVAADEQNITGQISAVAGRAPYFLIFNEKGALLETVLNPYCNIQGGAGSKTAVFLARKEINLVMAGRFGRKMRITLDSVKIKYVEHQGGIMDGIGEVTHAN